MPRTSLGLPYCNSRCLVVIACRYPVIGYVDYALAAGAEGYLLKENADTELFIAVDRIRRGECYVSPLVAGGGTYSSFR